MAGNGLGAFIDGAMRGYSFRKGWKNSDEDRSTAREDRTRRQRLEDEQNEWTREQQDWARGDREWTGDRRDRTRVLETRDDEQYQFEKDLYETGNQAAEDGRVIEVPGAVRPSAVSGGDGSDGLAGGQGGDRLAGYRSSLIGTESGGNLRAYNNEVGSGGARGHGGRIQMGAARLEDAARAGVIPKMSPAEYARQPEAVQKRVEDWHFGDIEQSIDRNGLAKYIGQDVNGDGVPETRDGMVAVAHLGGQGGLRKFLTSGGAYDPADAYGTSLSDYAEIHAGDSAGGSRRASASTSPGSRGNAGRPTGPGRARQAAPQTAGTFAANEGKDVRFDIPQEAMGAMRAEGPRGPERQYAEASYDPIPAIRINIPQAPSGQAMRGAVRPVDPSAGAQKRGVARALPLYRTA